MLGQHKPAPVNLGSAPGFDPRQMQRVSTNNQLDHHSTLLALSNYAALGRGNEYSTSTARPAGEIYNASSDANRKGFA